MIDYHMFTSFPITSHENFIKSADVTRSVGDGVGVGLRSFVGMTLEVQVGLACRSNLKDCNCMEEQRKPLTEFARPTSTCTRYDAMARAQEEVEAMSSTTRIIM